MQTIRVELYEGPTWFCAEVYEYANGWPMITRVPADIGARIVEQSGFELDFDYELLEDGSYKFLTELAIEPDNIN